MDVTKAIEDYIDSLPEPKRGELRTLHVFLQQQMWSSRLWFIDGRNEEQKVVSNPSIGYGRYSRRYADGSRREYYRVGLSANSAGISVYVLGIDDKTFLARTFGATIGKATITGYCIRFRKLADIDLDVLAAAVTASG